MPEIKLDREYILNHISGLLSMIDSRKQTLCMRPSEEIKKHVKEEIENLEKRVQEYRDMLNK